MEIKTTNQADIMIVNALNDIDTLLAQFRTTDDATRVEIVNALEIYVNQLAQATYYKVVA
jgi:hypothetical protein